MTATSLNVNGKPKQDEQTVKVGEYVAIDGMTDKVKKSKNHKASKSTNQKGSKSKWCIILILLTVVILGASILLVQIGSSWFGLKKLNIFSNEANCWICFSNNKPPVIQPVMKPIIQPQVRIPTKSNSDFKFDTESPYIVFFPRLGIKYPNPHYKPRTTSTTAEPATIISSQISIDPEYGSVIGKVVDDLKPSQTSASRQSFAELKGSDVFEIPTVKRTTLDSASAECSSCEK